MTADELDASGQLAAHVADDGRLGAAHVGQQRAGAAMTRRLDDGGGDDVHRRTEDHEVGIRHGGGWLRMRLVEHSVAERLLQHERLCIGADDAGGDTATPRGQGDGAAQQTDADDGQSGNAHVLPEKRE